ncbi:MAG: BON domain-containing protein [Rhodoferax sp.]|nr:BON domain-containing protein [Rhodoferax sp.]
MKIRLRNFCAMLLCVGVAGGTLTACAPIIFGGAAMSALVATDRRTSGAQLEDEGIELRAAGRIRESLGDRVHINVTSYNRQVLVTGEVSNAQNKQLVEQIVSRVENVRSIVNEVALLESTTLTQRSSDALTTGKVKAAMVDAKDLYSNAFKVVTERGTTYLMGLVTQREATRATDIARGTGGVLKVVRVFEIISEAELQRTLPQSAPASLPSAAPKT